jgi:hypothetical protein
MLFIKAGTLREALGLVRDEKMLDGQDPLVIMNACSQARMNAAVMVEIEVSGGKHGPQAAEVQSKGASTATLLPQERPWPVLLKMYVAVQSPPFQRSQQAREWYVFARRIQPEHSISGFLARMAEKRLNFVMHVR